MEKLLIFYKQGENEYYCSTVVDNDGNFLLEKELKKRIEKISSNLEKCGSVKKLLALGGDKTKSYLQHTQEMLKDYLVWSQVGTVFFTEEDVKNITHNLMQSESIKRLIFSSWNDIEKTATKLRSSFLQQHFSIV